MSTRLWFTLDGFSHHPSALPVQGTSQFITTMLATLLMKSAAKRKPVAGKRDRHPASYPANRDALPLPRDRARSGLLTPILGCRFSQYTAIMLSCIAFRWPACEHHPRYVNEALPS
jgi:hypothetical protein